MAKEKNITKRIETLLEYLCQNCYRKQGNIKQALLCVLAKKGINYDEPNSESKIIKTMIQDRLKLAFAKSQNNDEDLSAFIDSTFTENFVIRDNTHGLTDEEFLDYITHGIPVPVPTNEQTDSLLSLSEINSWQDEICKIELSDSVKKLLLNIREDRYNYNKQNIDDLKDKIHTAQTSAFFNGRNKVLLSDVVFFGFTFHNYSYDFLKYCDDERFKYIEYGFRDFIKQYNMNDVKEPSAVKIFKKLLEEKYNESIAKINEVTAILKSCEKELNSENIFAHKMYWKKYFEDLLGSINDTIRHYKWNQESIQENYDEFEFSFVSDVNLGDHILKDGSICAKYEPRYVGYGEDRHISNPRLAVICLKGNKADSIFGISLKKWTEKDYAETTKIASEFNGEDSPVYSSDWTLPTIEQLEQIYKNITDVDDNDGLQELKKQLRGCYWSSTQKDKDAAYYFDFSKGKKDYTTLDHKYNVALLHKFCIDEE